MIEIIGRKEVDHFYINDLPTFYIKYKNKFIYLIDDRELDLAPAILIVFNNSYVVRNIYISEWSFYKNNIFIRILTPEELLEILEPNLRKEYLYNIHLLESNDQEYMEKILNDH